MRENIELNMSKVRMELNKNRDKLNVICQTKVDTLKKDKTHLSFEE